MFIQGYDLKKIALKNEIKFSEETLDVYDVHMQKPLGNNKMHMIGKGGK